MDNRSDPRRRWIAAGAAGLVFLVAVVVVTVNVSTGLAQTDRTIPLLSLPDIPAPAAPTTDASSPLSATWRPPADLPAGGTIGSVRIPATASGFSARDAQVYLPPAALVPDAPALPFVLMMMGQPGDPDAGPIAAVLDAFAAAHNGLAPIVLVADQLGDPDVDSLCLDTAEYGRVETYLEQDVVSWARDNLNIEAGRDAWTVAGFSNGGQCALSLALRYPEVWGSVVDASGTVYAGLETEPEVLADVFGGDQAAYDATKPATLLGKSRYPDTMAVFTVGSEDSVMEPGLKDLSQTAKAAGVAVTYYEVPGEGHSLEALDGGLTEAFGVLASRLGLGPQ
ncbi:alpha/beta hydrolase [Cryobacterium sp. 5B3]|uniref:alpha/beta hydrolase n=1 Tax=Cryobacterium sp. 5B3 TaxID=3048586 RepID=UPI002AB59AB4|nr:alpha/beta hydrolase-fold protein [Cryobacterium sp. 5B3]MDY7542043.1 alpha/beta hydrolase-fold protein [Cryobacterium sp. 5B3]MEB0274422.1 alpha/beta hydrolase-fold protein [Cryobacterium sp. 5B3]